MSDRPVIEVPATYNSEDKTYTLVVDSFIFNEIMKGLKALETRREATIKSVRKYSTHVPTRRGIVYPTVRIIDPTPPGLKALHVTPPTVLPIIAPEVPKTKPIVMTSSLQVGTASYAPPRVPRVEPPPKTVFNYSPIHPVLVNTP
jgi:hypothetical protein